MARALCILLVASIALVTTGSPAAAARRAPVSTASSRTMLAVTVAHAVWGPACGGTKVTIEWGDARTSDERVHGGYAAWTGADGRPQGEGPPALRTRCRVMLDRALAREFVRGDSWPVYCSMIVHEFGHLTGHDHSTDPLDVMSPTLSVSTPACEQMLRWA